MMSFWEFIEAMSPLQSLAATAEEQGFGDKIETLCYRGFTAKEIAQKLGIDRKMVIAVRNTRGIPSSSLDVGGAIIGSKGKGNINPEFIKWKQSVADKHGPPAPPKPKPRVPSPPAIRRAKPPLPPPPPS